MGPFFTQNCQNTIVSYTVKMASILALGWVSNKNSTLVRVGTSWV